MSDEIFYNLWDHIWWRDYLAWCQSLPEPDRSLFLWVHAKFWSNP